MVWWEREEGWRGGEESDRKQKRRSAREASKKKRGIPSMAEPSMGSPAVETRPFCLRTMLHIR